MRYFYSSLTVTLVGILTSFWWGGWPALALTLMLSMLEISLSVDNAIVNASVLQKMNPKWQRRFITWGTFIAVFVVRFLIPLILVAVTSSLSIIEVINLALNNPKEYSEHLRDAHPAISSFGGLFLLLVFLSFILNQERKIYWFSFFERNFNRIGKFGPINILIASFVLLVLYNWVSDNEKMQVLYAGLLGIFIFTLINSLIEFLNKPSSLTITKNASLLGFIYLEILDASFSLDSVISAFAITRDLVIIFIGLAIGAIFVRSFTLYLTHRGTLKKYQYLEHGANYAIGALSIIMLLSLKFHIPELITGFVGISFILLALISSLWHNRK